MDCSFGSKKTKCNVVFSGKNYRSVGTISFEDSTNYNSVVKFPKNASYSLNNCFRGCKNYNRAVIIPNGVDFARNMFYECNNFNALVSVKGKMNDYGCRNMFAFTKFNRDFTLGYQDTDRPYYDILRNCNNYQAMLTVNAGIMDFSGEITDGNHYHWSGAVILNNGPYNGYVLSTIDSTYGITETEGHLGARVKFPYYQNAVIELVEAPTNARFGWENYCFKAVKWGNLPQLPYVL